MRRVLMIAAVAGFAHTAQAADMPSFLDLPILRGTTDTLSHTTSNWQGYYVGAHASTANAQMDFRNATRDMVARMMVYTAIEEEFRVSEWPLLGGSSRNNTGFGGFVGYNGQWDDVVIGLEANYTHSELTGSSTGTLSRIVTTSNGYTNDVTVSATAAMALHDMASLRARAGYAWGFLLPYAYAGVSFGRADVTRTATVSGIQSNPNAPPGFQVVPFSVTDTKLEKDKFLVGYSAGIGVDMQLLGNIFVRGEWEYTRLTGGIDTTVHAAKLGGGIKF